MGQCREGWLDELGERTAIPHGTFIVPRQAIVVKGGALWGSAAIGGLISRHCYPRNRHSGFCRNLRTSLDSGLRRGDGSIPKPSEKKR